MRLLGGLASVAEGAAEDPLAGQLCAAAPWPCSGGSLRRRAAAPDLALAAVAQGERTRSPASASSFLLLGRDSARGVDLGQREHAAGPVASSFAAAGITEKTPRLGEVRLRLLYQTPEVYMTDVAKQRLPATLGFRYACKQAPDDSGLGESKWPPRMHPSITFNSDKVRKVHVHLEDTKTGQVFWDADFKLPRRGPVSVATGKSNLPSVALPQDITDVFRTPCLATDDWEPHLFDLSVQTQDGVYEDGVTPWGPREGFQNLDGEQAHIGFEAYRVPVLKTGLDGEQEEVLGLWRPGGHFSRGGPVHSDRFERILAKEEDPFWDDIKGNGRLYYDYIIRPEARSRNQYAYLGKYGLPSKFL